MAASPRVLIVEADERVQRGLCKLLQAPALEVIAVSDAAQARAAALEQRYAAIVVDHDLPSPGGLDLLRQLRSQSSDARLFLMVSQKSEEVTLQALRLGVTDVLHKVGTEVDYLKQRVFEACRSANVELSAMALFAQAIALEDDLLSKLRDKSRQLAALQRKRTPAASTATADHSVLVVEEDGWLGYELSRSLTLRGGYVVQLAQTGGEALDTAPSSHYRIALISNVLPDLSGTMVASGINSHSPDTLTIRFQRPTESRAGRAEIIDGPKTLPLLESLTKQEQLIEKVEELCQASLRRAEERQVIVQFREENQELLRRSADLRQRIGQRYKLS